MGFHTKSITSLIALGLCAALLACAGVTSGGGAGDAPTSSISGGQNSLDGGPSADGGLPGGASAQGQAVPSTQQSEPGVGAPCVIRFVASVQVTRGAYETFCRENSMAAMRLRAVEEVRGEDSNTMAPPEDPPPGPEVTLTFRADGDIEDRSLKVPTHCAEDGRWRTALGDLSFFTIPRGLHCPNFSVKAQAIWNQGGTPLISPLYSGSQTLEYDEATEAYPIPLGIDLGPMKYDAEGLLMRATP